MNTPKGALLLGVAFWVANQSESGASLNEGAKGSPFPLSA